MEEMESYNKKELEILKLPHRYLIFLDEVGDSFLHFDLEKYNDPSIFPVMTVAAVVVSKKVYADILMPGLDEIKKYFFKDKNVYFHSREIRRKDGIFKIFLNKNLYLEFKTKIDELLEKSSITIISSSIRKIKLVQKAKKDDEILFFNKQDNINGLQIADYCTYPFARHAKNPSDINNKLFIFLRKFIYKGDYSEYGLKEWP